MSAPDLRTLVQSALNMQSGIWDRTTPWEFCEAAWRLVAWEAQMAEPTDPAHEPRAVVDAIAALGRAHVMLGALSEYAPDEGEDAMVLGVAAGETLAEMEAALVALVDMATARGWVR